MAMLNMSALRYFSLLSLDSPALSTYGSICIISDESSPEPVLAAPGGGGYLLYSSWNQEGVTKLFPGKLFSLLLSLCLVHPHGE